MSSLGILNELFTLQLVEKTKETIIFIKRLFQIRWYQIATNISFFGHIFLIFRQHPVVSAGVAAVYRHREPNPEWQFWKPRTGTQLNPVCVERLSLLGTLLVGTHRKLCSLLVKLRLKSSYQLLLVQTSWFVSALVWSAWPWRLELWVSRSATCPST